MRARQGLWFAASLVAALVGAAAPAHAQYFGRNKVQYRTFDFQKLTTEHFDIYYYPEEADAAKMIARMAERWQSRLSRFFDHELRGRQPIILYASAEHFRQTNAVEGLIGEGTGGVTEALKRRVIVPMAGTLADTDHVLGHELVHAFQFDMTGAALSPSNQDGPAILGFPLWFVEGMAEYVSLGPVDPQTAMWLRDAVAQNQVPSLKDLDNPKFFPYRWGQAFFAYVGARWGDRQIASLLRSAVNPRFDLTGLALQLGTTPKALEDDWHRAMRDAANAVAQDLPSVASEPHRLIGLESGGGHINVGPRLSPDGRRIAFFSERDLFSVDLYVADARSGVIEHRLIHSATDPHFGSLQFLYSAGAWSPDGQSLALAVVRGGQPALAIVDAQTGDIRREIPLPGLADAIGPAWSPDGGAIVLSGNRGGLIDLFRVTVATGTVEALTNDAFADLEPTFTPDGRSIVFVTERFSADLVALVPGPLRLARMDLATREVVPIVGFLTGKHLSPCVSPDGKTLTFIAEPDGISNVYRMAIDGGPISRVSALNTGVAGITPTSPALSVAAGTGTMAFSVFERGGNAIYTLDDAHVIALVPPDTSVRAAILPSRSVPGGVLYGLLTDYSRGLPPLTVAWPPQPYRSHLALEAIGPPTLSGGVSVQGAQFGGGMSASFSDLLGDRVLGVGAAIQGTFADVGAAALYLNRRHRWTWGAEVDETPNAIGFLTTTNDPVTNTSTATASVFRQTTGGAAAVALLPFNESDRIEMMAGVRHYNPFTEEDRTEVAALDSGQLISSTDQTTTLARSLNALESGVALVHDTSFFGATSPIYGGRYRLELDRTSGTLQYTGVLVDVRKYFMPRRPITIGFRVVHSGRYGRDAEDPELISLFAGYPEFVHGYGYGSFSAAECGGSPSATLCPPLAKLFGSRLLVGNVEVRAPLVGLFRGKVEYGRVPVEVAAFYDAGVAWTRAAGPVFTGPNSTLVRSVGGAVRLNLLGFVVVELSAAHPFDRPDKSLRWQFGLRLGF
jgi:hypothetical protein